MRISDWSSDVCSSDLLDHEGRGFARVDGKATFIADALPGERVRFKYLRTSRDLDEAQCIAVETPSPHRVTPGCTHFGLCGGCSMQHLASSSAERRVGKECVSTGRYRWSPSH